MMLIIPGILLGLMVGLVPVLIGEGDDSDGTRRDEELEYDEIMMKGNFNEILKKGSLLY